MFNHPFNVFDKCFLNGSIDKFVCDHVIKDTVRYNLIEYFSNNCSKCYHANVLGVGCLISFVNKRNIISLILTKPLHKEGLSYVNLAGIRQSYKTAY